MALFVQIQVDKVSRETEKAYLFTIDDEDFWIPKSQVREGEGVIYEGMENIQVEVTKWIATEKNLEFTDERRY